MSLEGPKTSQAPMDWDKVFPKLATETYTSSVKFMKQLTIIALSTLIHSKNIIHEDNFIVEKFGGLHLKILKKRCRDGDGQFISTALVHSFEAFDKKYLQKLALCFYDGDYKADNLIEYYVLQYSYKGDGMTMNVTAQGRDSGYSKYTSTFDNIRRSTEELIHACVAMQSAQPLPDAVKLSLRLYYNEDTPSGYQAPGFYTLPEQEDPLVESCLWLGRVATRFHSVRVGAYIPATQASCDAQPSVNAPVMTQNEDNYNNIAELQSDTFTECEPRVLCPCTKTDDCGDQLMLTCNYCGTLQHAACFGRRRGNEGARWQRGALHCCTRCSDTDSSRQPTDTRLANVKKRTPLCIFRRVLAWCCDLRALPMKELVEKFDLSPVTAANLLKALQHLGVIENTDIDTVQPRKIMRDKLNSVMSDFFCHEESELVERLLAEMLLEANQPDPVTDVLGPMEAVTLQNATTLGKMIEPPQQESGVRDETLHQYMQVVLSRELEVDLPPSDQTPLHMGTSADRTTKRKAKSTRAGMNKRVKTKN